MEKQSSQPLGENLFKPAPLSPDQEDLCRRMDELHTSNGLKTKPSEMFRGAIFVARSQLRNNPDWIAQAANSLREIIYQFNGKKGAPNKEKALRQYGSVLANKPGFATELGKVFNEVTELAHHGNGKSGTIDFSNFKPSDFDQLIARFERVMTELLRRQVDIHQEIDALLGFKKEDVQKIIGLNPDAKQYFFAKADDSWLSWLWDNGFLEVIKEPAVDPTRYGYRTPEITYLTNVATKAPEKVVQIILDPDTATTRERFNPELIDQFLRICAELPAEQLALVVPKIYEQGWVKTMGAFNNWGFDYEKMFKILLSAKDYKSVLLLAETVLVIRTKEEVAKTANGFGTDNPFCFSNLEHSGVFDALNALSEEYLEEGLSLSTKIMGQIALLAGDNDDPERAFPVKDSFYLFDIDFFTLVPDASKHLSYRDDVKEVAAVIKTLLDKTLGKKCDSPDVVKEFYDKYIGTLPESRAMWRVRLYALSLCPEAIKDKLKEAFFKLFDSRYYTDITSGTEYEKTLQGGFGVLSDPDKRKYVAKTVEYFSKHEKGGEEERWHLNAGSDIFSVIAAHLTEEEQKNIVSAGFKIKADYEPVPTISPIETGFVQSQGPITPEEFGQLPVVEIATRLRTSWAPKSLRDKYKEKDHFLNPHNAEGTGDLLKGDIQKRPKDYIQHAEKFFDRGALDAHYTYSFLRGIEDVVKSNRELAEQSEWEGVIKMFTAITISGNENSFEKEKRSGDSFDAWLAGWNAVHSGMTDVLQTLLRESNDKTVINFHKYRDQIFSVIDYLLGYPNPTPQEEDPKSPAMTSSGGGTEQLVSDPFSTAINTVRGRAFQALTLFIYPDGRELPEGLKIKTDVKELYEKVLAKEDTRALMFMFGHHLPQFYFREPDWLQRLLPQIFPIDEAKKNLFLAAWEGYLSDNLYKEFFTNPAIEPLYYRGLSISDIKETTRQYFRDPDEGMATHLALAFMHYPEFGFDHPLFKAFWKNDSPQQQKEFIGFLGKNFVSGDNTQVKDYLSKEPRAKEILKNFWEWILNNRNEPELFEEFGFWVNLEKNIFEPAWLAEHLHRTLEKTKGKLDWDYGLTKTALTLAQNDPVNTLAIARLIFLDGGVRVNHKRRQFYVDREWFDVFKALYDNLDTKSGTEKLINDLIEEGGNPFWGLKSIINDNK